MRLWFFISALFAVGFLPSGDASAQNTQPISTSLAECGVIFDIVGSNASAGKDPKQVQMLLDGAEKFINEAVRQAEMEGHKKASVHVFKQLEMLEPKWENKLGNVFTLNETLDWIQYCGKLGKSRNLFDDMK